MINNQIAGGVPVSMCPESESPHFSHIFFQHGYLTYYSTYLLGNLYVYSLDVYRGKGVSMMYGLVFVFLYVEDGI